MPSLSSIIGWSICGAIIAAAFALGFFPIFFLHPALAGLIVAVIAGMVIRSALSGLGGIEGAILVRLFLLVVVAGFVVGLIARALS